MGPKGDRGNQGQQGPPGYPGSKGYCRDGNPGKCTWEGDVFHGLFGPINNELLVGLY